VLRLAADENFNNVILRGLRRRRPELDVLRVQDAGLTSAAIRRSGGVPPRFQPSIAASTSRISSASASRSIHRATTTKSCSGST
jgi:hypothetical protein